METKNNPIVKAMENLIETLTADIKHDLLAETYSAKEYTLVDCLLNIYNRWQEGLRDGVDYIFNINDKQDVKCVLNDKDIAVDDIIDTFNKQDVNGKYFYYGANYPTIKTLTEPQLAQRMIAFLGEIILYMFKYDMNSAEAKYITEQYITEFLNDPEI